MEEEEWRSREEGGRKEGGGREVTDVNKGALFAHGEPCRYGADAPHDLHEQRASQQHTRHVHTVQKRLPPRHRRKHSENPHTSHGAASCTPDASRAVTKRTRFTRSSALLHLAIWTSARRLADSQGKCPTSLLEGEREPCIGSGGARTSTVWVSCSTVRDGERREWQADKSDERCGDGLGDRGPERDWDTGQSLASVSEAGCRASGFSFQHRRTRRHALKASTAATAIVRIRVEVVHRVSFRLELSHHSPRPRRQGFSSRTLTSGMPEPAAAGAA